VNIALGHGGAPECARADADGDGLVRLDDLVKAIGSALRGC